LRDKGHVQTGEQVLIHGATGGVGTFAVQLAKAFGAEVTAVCSTRNVELVRSLGADHIVDYQKEDVTKRRERYDLILAVNGYHPLLSYRRALRPTGRYVMIGASNAHLMQALLQVVLVGSMLSRAGKRKMGLLMMRNPPQKDLAQLRDLLEARAVKPVIDRRYPLGEAAEAVRYVEDGHARGKVVLVMDQSINS